MKTLEWLQNGKNLHMKKRTTWLEYYMNKGYYMKRLQRERSVFHIFNFLSGSWKPLTVFTQMKFRFIFEKTRSTGSLYNSCKPQFRLNKISKEVLTWCLNKLKSISFPRESLKNNLSYWITHMQQIRKKLIFGKFQRDKISVTGKISANSAKTFRD